MNKSENLPNIKKIKVKDMPLSIDKYIGIASPNREDDEKAREEYISEKYGI